MVVLLKQSSRELTFLKSVRADLPWLSHVMALVSNQTLELGFHQ
jgi:hypothetical protein